MVSLVSPEYNLEKFCNHMRGKDLMAVIDAASAEICYARRLHYDVTGEFEFQKGARGYEYCENLQRLVSILVTGSVPDDNVPDFIITITPLIQELLQVWEIGTLRQVFLKNEVHKDFNSPESIDPLVIVISRDEVEAMDTSTVLGALSKLTTSPSIAKEFVERVEISFLGYDQTREELFEIPQVRNFVHQMDEQFPFWLYFLSKQYLGLQCILLCFLPPFLTDEARAIIFPERMGDLLRKRWFPAMNHICEYVGFSDIQIEQLTERAMTYISTI